MALWRHARWPHAVSLKRGSMINSPKPIPGRYSKLDCFYMVLQLLVPISHGQNIRTFEAFPEELWSLHSNDLFFDCQKMSGFMSNLKFLISP